MTQENFAHSPVLTGLLWELNEMERRKRESLRVPGTSYPSQQEPVFGCGTGLERIEEAGLWGEDRSSCRGTAAVHESGAADSEASGGPGERSAHFLHRAVGCST